MTEHPTITALRKLRKPSDRSVELVRLTESTAAAKSWVAQSAQSAPHLLAEVDALRAQLAAAREAVAQWYDTEHAAACWVDATDPRDRHCSCGSDDNNRNRSAARLALGLEVKP